MSGILGRKVGMTTVFDEAGNQIVCTVIEAGPCAVTQVKTDETDGYAALQLAFGTKKAKHTTKAMQGHFEKAGVDLARTLVEFRDHALLDELGLGDTLTVDRVFNAGDKVDVVGRSKGKGFQGVVKRHGFGGIMQQTHGQHNRLRAPGSIGSSSYPSRVFKGVRMAGKTGTARVTVKNLRVFRVLADQNVLLLRGAVPGPKNAVIEIRKRPA